MHFFAIVNVMCILTLQNHDRLDAHYIFYAGYIKKINNYLVFTSLSTPPKYIN